MPNEFDNSYTPPPEPVSPTQLPYPTGPTMAYDPPKSQPPARKSGCGCWGCALGCLGVSLLLVIGGAVGAWWFVQKIPDMAREAVDKAIQESDLADADKKIIMAQVDRVVDGYKSGEVDMQKLGNIAEKLIQSPLMGLMIAHAAKAKYIDPSGLSAEEKTSAERILQRVTRGVVEKKISKDELDVALNQISNETPNGGRTFREQVSDEELRAFLNECGKLADKAEIPDEEFQIDIGAEVEKLVDDVLNPNDSEEAPTPEAPLQVPDTEPATDAATTDTAKAEASTDNASSNTDPGTEPSTTAAPPN